MYLTVCLQHAGAYLALTGIHLLQLCAAQAPKQAAAAVSPSIAVRPISRQYCVTAAAGTAGSMSGSPSGPRRIILWFRNDLRLRDNAIIHTAVQKLQAKEFDEVRLTG